MAVQLWLEFLGGESAADAGVPWIDRSALRCRDGELRRSLKWTSVLHIPLLCACLIFDGSVEVVWQESD
jgi:hypothetical protein